MFCRFSLLALNKVEPRLEPLFPALSQVVKTDVGTRRRLSSMFKAL